MVNSSSFELDKELALAFCNRHRAKFSFCSHRDSTIRHPLEDMASNKELPHELESCSSKSQLRKQQCLLATTSTSPYATKLSHGNYSEESCRPQTSQDASNSVRKLANPSPLGLCAFALTTFVLSLINIQARGVQTNNIVLGLALFYGGLVQLLAGMWEFATGNSKANPSATMSTA